jgi:ABC-2 type transport system permease protein
MRTTWTVARNELRLLLRDRIVWAVLVVLGASIWYAMAIGAHRIREARAAELEFLQREQQAHLHHQTLARATEQRIASGEEHEQSPPPYGTRHPVYVAAWDRQPVVLPPSGFEWLALGNSDLYAPGFFGPEHEEVVEVRSPVQLMTGYVDLAFVCVSALPIMFLAVFYGLSQAAGDGVDRLAISQGVAARTLVAGRAAATVILVLGPTLLFVVAALPTIPVDWDAASVARVGIALAMVSVYLLFWASLAAVVDRYLVSAVASAGPLFTAWLLIVVLIPLVAHQTAAWLRPIPTRAEVIHAIRTAPERVSIADQREIVAAFLARHPDYPRPDTLAPLGRMYLEGAARNEARDQIIADAEQRIRDAGARQQQLVDALSMLSPAALLQRGLMGLAGTDRERYARFLRLKESYDAEYLRFFNPRKFDLPQSPFHAADYDRIPTMRYADEPLLSVLRRIAWTCVSLALYVCGMVSVGMLTADHSCFRAARRA